MPRLPSDWFQLESEYLIRQRLRSNLLDWCIETLSQIGQSPAAHHRLLLQELDALAHGMFNRLMVLMPPGSAKSTYTSILFPAWWFTQFPRSSVIAASHTQSLADHFSRQVRGLISSRRASLGYDLVQDERGTSHWRTSTGGEYYAASVRGAVTGRRADLAIIDDPVRSRLEAESAGSRERLWSWYRSDLMTRLKPGGRVILIMTRWHEDDLGGQLLSQNRNEWHVVRLPAIADCLDPLGRSVGEPIWPSWETLDTLLQKRTTVGERIWASMFQQAPRPPQGSLFKVDCLDMTDHAPDVAGSRVVRGWDLAATSALGGRDPDWTVGVKLSSSGSNRCTVLDVVRFRGSPRQVEDTIAVTARQDGAGVWIGLPEDPGQAGKSQIAYLAGRLSGYKVIASRETGSKLTRALPVASQVEANNFAILRADWNHMFIEELRDFPYGRKDDQVDALVRAFETTNRIANPGHKTNVPLFLR